VRHRRTVRIGPSRSRGRRVSSGRAPVGAGGYQGTNSGPLRAVSVPSHCSSAHPQGTYASNHGRTKRDFMDHAPGTPTRIEGSRPHRHRKQRLVDLTLDSLSSHARRLHLLGRTPLVGVRVRRRGESRSALGTARLLSSSPERMVAPCRQIPLDIPSHPRTQLPEAAAVQAASGDVKALNAALREWFAGFHVYSAPGGGVRVQPLLESSAVDRLIDRPRSEDTFEQRFERYRLHLPAALTGNKSASAVCRPSAPGFAPAADRVIAPHMPFGRAFGHAVQRQCPLGKIRRDRPVATALGAVGSSPPLGSSRRA
jgi:hypothetical protein